MFLVILQDVYDNILTSLYKNNFSKVLPDKENSDNLSLFFYNSPSENNIRPSENKTMFL